MGFDSLQSLHTGCLSLKPVEIVDSIYKSKAF